MKLAANKVLHKRSKHIEVRCHYVKDVIDRFKVQVFYIPTSEMIADVFTKLLSCNKLELFTNQLGVT